MTLRILIADDHALFRDGVAALLQSRGHQVVGQAADGLHVLELARSLQPDLILMDIHMPRLDGLHAARLLSAEMPSTRVVMLTVSEESEDLFEAIKSGAQGYILKNTDTETFFQLIESAAAGEAPITRRVAGRILVEWSRTLSEGRGGGESEAELTDREVQILQAVSEGLTNRDIAARLSLSENTIKYHLKNILQKLHLRNRAQAVDYAHRSGLLKIKPPGT